MINCNKWIARFLIFSCCNAIYVSVSNLIEGRQEFSVLIIIISLFCLVYALKEHKKVR